MIITIGQATYKRN